MSRFELKLPPLVWAALVAVAMALVAAAAPTHELPPLLRRMGAGVLAVLGVALVVAGVIGFRRAGTTLNPMRPQQSAALVSSGVYRISRNPMYLGMLLLLLAWALWLSLGWTLAGPPAFVWLMNRWQIAPEERALTTLFGDDYAAYRAQVRRWL